MLGAFIKVKVPGARGCLHQILCIIYHSIDVTIDELDWHWPYFVCNTLFDQHLHRFFAQYICTMEQYKYISTVEQGKTYSSQKIMGTLEYRREFW